jgi:hypothetical protein
MANVTVSDAITASEAVAASLRSYPIAGDTITASDAVAMYIPVTLLVVEPVTVTEFLYLDPLSNYFRVTVDGVYFRTVLDSAYRRSTVPDSAPWRLTIGRDG